MPLRFVKLNARDGLELDGALACEPSDLACVIHVHGKCGNFYQNSFLQTMFDVYAEAGISFLAFNNRGHDCVAEGYNDQELVYTGGSLEIFSQCIDDIAGALAFISQRCPGRPIFLQGHSNGCEKLIYYLRQDPDIRVSGAIILSAADSRQIHAQFISPRTIEKQISDIVTETSTMGFLPLSNYGIRNGDAAYFIPIARDALLNILTSGALDIIRFSGDAEIKPIELPAFAYIGGADILRTAPVLEVQNIISRLFDRTEYLVLNGGDHHFHGYEDQVARAVAAWIIDTAMRSNLT